MMMMKIQTVDVINLAVVCHDGNGRFLHSSSDLVFNNVEHVLIIEQADQMKGAEAGGTA